MGAAMVADSVNGLHEVEFMDFMFMENPEQKAISHIQDSQPDVIGISVRILDSQNSQNPQSPITELKSFVQHIKRISESPVVLGGAAFTTFPVEMMEFVGADYGIAGQAENVFPQLMECIQEGNVDESLPGLVFQKNGTTIKNPPIIEGYPDSFMPTRHYYNFKPYRKGYWPGIVLMKSGCPFHCLYCDNHVTAGSQYRLRSPEVIVDELAYQVRALNNRVFHLADPCYNVPLDYAKTVLEAIIRSNLKIVAMTPIRPGNLDEELVVLMKRSGIVFVALGADTLSQTMLESYRKGSSIGEVAESCRLLQKHHLGYMLECIFGGPGETVHTLEESLGFLEKVRPSLTLLNAGLRILPETGLYQIALDEGLINCRSDLLFPKFYFSRSIDGDLLRNRIQAFNKQYGRRNSRMALVFLRRYVRLWFGKGH